MNNRNQLRKGNTIKRTIVQWEIWTEADGLIDSSGNASFEQMTKLVKRTANEGPRELLAEIHEFHLDSTGQIELEGFGSEHVAWITD
tara:strand:- start:427 stop:687 length:261 start_codon:yes stop_codon:yes gene_type:complete